MALQNQLPTPHLQPPSKPLVKKVIIVLLSFLIGGGIALSILASIVPIASLNGVLFAISFACMGLTIMVTLL